MISEMQLEHALEQPVYDAEGHKIGKPAHLFNDDATGKPEWVSVKTGWFGNNETFVPIRDARMVEDHLEVPYTRDTIKGAPNVDVDAGGHLPQSEEERLYRHYGITWDDAWRQANQPGPEGWAHSAGRGGAPDADTAAGSAGTAGMAGAGGTAGSAGSAGMAAGTAGRADAGTTAGMKPGAAGTAGAAAGTGTAAGTAAAGSRPGARDTDNAMTRSEEHLRVGVERQEAGHARLHKYVVTETEQQTVPLRHDEVRIEREPITEANRGEAMSGPEISEAEHEVTLHAEHAVVKTEAVPVERVRMTVEERVEEETVTGEVRKERIEVELPKSAGPAKQDPAPNPKHRRA